MFCHLIHIIREIEAYSQLMASLCTCLQHLQTLYSWRATLENGQYSLFASDEHSAHEFLSRAENINQYCFYGRCLGFQVNDLIYDKTIKLAFSHLKRFAIHYLKIFSSAIT